MSVFFDAVVPDLRTNQNYIFGGNNEYNGSTNAFSAYPTIATYSVPTTDTQLVPKKYTDDTFVKLGANNTLTGIQNFNNNLIVGDNIGNDTVTINANIIANSTTITPTQLSKVQYVDVASSLTTLLNAKASTSYVDTKVSSIVNSAPATLDTLNELAAALGNDPNYATSTATLIGTKAPIANPTFTGTVGGITAAMVGLGNVNNTSDSAKPISTAQQTALDLKAPIANPTFTGTIGGITASMVGLGNVSNTSDVNKPVSTAQQTALDLKANLASPTFTGTLACSSLTPTGLITSNRFTELITAVSGSSPYTLNFNSGNVFYLSGTQPSSNFTCTISNIPTGGTLNQYTVTLIYNSSTACFCNSVSVTDTSSGTIVASGTPKYANNAAPTLSNSSVYIQTFTVISCFSTKYCITNVTTFN